MTENYLNKWLANNSFYLMEINDYETDNPDQRISDDVNAFTVIF